MTRRVIVAGAIVLAVTALLAAPAAAHVTIDPPSVPQGSSSAHLSFIVPNESEAARTNKVQLYFPGSPNAIPEASVEPLEGWHFAIRKQPLSSPIVTDEGSIDEVVSTITWVANNASTAIGADEFVAFSVNIDGIPEASNELVFRVVQTYTDGSSVRWVDPVSDTGPEAEHPTPILELTGGANSDGEPTATTEPAAPEPADSSGTTTISAQDDNARALAVIGIIVGGVALVAATGALMRRRRAR